MCSEVEHLPSMCEGWVGSSDTHMHALIIWASFRKKVTNMQKTRHKWTMQIWIRLESAWTCGCVFCVHTYSCLHVLLLLTLFNWDGWEVQHQQAHLELTQIRALNTVNKAVRIPWRSGWFQGEGGQENTRLNYSILWGQEATLNK